MLKFIILWILCLFGATAVIPYLHALGLIPPEVTMQEILPPVLIQTALLCAVLLLITYYVLPKTDLKPFSFDNFWRDILLPGTIVGSATGFFIILADKTIFSPDLPYIPAWTGVLASFYGGINEEVLFRLCFLTFLYFFISNLMKNRIAALWTSTVIVALAFAAAHLVPALYLGMDSVTRILVLNSIPGIAFGWLYWSKNLYSASFAHFIADLIIHGLYA